MMVIGSTVNFARFRGATQLATSVMGLKLLKALSFLVHNSETIIEIIIPGAGMLQVQDWQ
jgi:hypothetical protein